MASFNARPGLTLRLTMGVGLMALLAGCTSGPATVRLSDGALSEGLAYRTATGVAIDQGIWLHLSQVRVRPVRGTDRLRADFSLDADEPGRERVRYQGWAFDARMTWQAADCSLRLTQVEADLAPPLREGDYAERQRELRLAAALGRRLDGMLVWTAAGTEWSQACAVARVRGEPGGVEIRLGE